MSLRADLSSTQFRHFFKLYGFTKGHLNNLLGGIPPDSAHDTTRKIAAEYRGLPSEVLTVIEYGLSEAERRMVGELHRAAAFFHDLTTAQSIDAARQQDAATEMETAGRDRNATQAQLQAARERVLNSFVQSLAVADSPQMARAQAGGANGLAGWAGRRELLLSIGVGAILAGEAIAQAMFLFMAKTPKNAYFFEAIFDPGNAYFGPAALAAVMGCGTTAGMAILAHVGAKALSEGFAPVGNLDSLSSMTLLGKTINRLRAILIGFSSTAGLCVVAFGLSQLRSEGGAVGLSALTQQTSGTSPTNLLVAAGMVGASFLGAALIPRIERYRQKRHAAQDTAAGIWSVLSTAVGQALFERSQQKGEVRELRRELRRAQIRLRIAHFTVNSTRRMIAINNRLRSWAKRAMLEEIALGIVPLVWVRARELRDLEWGIPLGEIPQYPDTSSANSQEEVLDVPFQEQANEWYRQPEEPKAISQKNGFYSGKDDIK
jgi:hypothetical protein